MPGMKTVWLIRHAESTANVGCKTANPTTVELTDAGKEQACKLAESVNTKPDLVVTSPFLRTLHTAQPLLAKFTGIRHEQWPIHEFTYLSPKKCDNTSTEERIPLAMEYWERNDPHYCDGDGAESFSAFIHRVADCKAMLEKRQEAFIVVFAHYQFINAFNWLNGNGGRPMVTPAQMTDFWKYLFSHQVENAQICEITL
jgi:2,3-bisphosphoglycerate-dependent phosphoglycerate mutase